MHAVNSMVVVKFFPELSDFSISIHARSVVTFIFSKSVIECTPYSIYLARSVVSYSAFKSDMVALIISFSKGCLLRVTHFELYLACSIDASMSLSIYT